ncbi:amino acid permease [Gordonia sp. PDNC005]|uniref:amino acid permease n=1 Tax=unclassified Gordonia (in: high G+C Gram-positive bacteria) TaxID=2657482 RepID=UPI001965E4C8|nr:amino acid permease [Gordonia sp. PDNC005]QRY61340.1 amino acid permease [Gordonia sp. PDNC005]
MSGTPELKKALSERQLRMIAIGGVIGAGLFVGSGVVIKATGPASFITYALAGVLVIMVMRMLAEMAVANPSTGSFSDYARNAMGNWAGFSVGWLYWYFWVVVVGFEAIAGAKIIQFWIPSAPIWLTSMLLLAAMTATNLFSVASFGEFEFWFAGIKVAAITLFIVLGFCFVFGLWPNREMDFSNLTSHGGFFPLGVGAVTVGVVLTIFSMVGAEIATIAAAESENPERAVAKAANSVIVRIAIFFVGSVFLLTAILPWNSDDLAASPFVSAIEQMGIPAAEHIMNAVVLTAVLSCLNSGMYTASRMLFVLAARREAPAQLVQVTKRGVPMYAIIGSSIIGFVCVIAAAFWEETIFAFLLNSSGAIILFVYLLIAVSQTVLRLRNGGENLKVKMWLFPVLSILTIVAILAILVQMYIDEAVRSQLVLSLLAFGVVIVLFFANRYFVQSRPATPDTAVQGHRPTSIVVLANQTVGSDELLSELRSIGADRGTMFHVVVPASPIETRAADVHGPLDVWEATTRIANERLEETLATLRTEGFAAEGGLGDYRPLRALAAAVEEHRPDRIVISTLPPEESVWERFDVIDRARAEHHLPVTHVVARMTSSGSVQ